MIRAIHRPSERRDFSSRLSPSARRQGLNLLLARPEARALKLTAAQKKWVPEAIERAMGISFDAYRSKVIAYLDPQQRVLYEEESACDAMQEAVVAQLEKLH